MINTQIDTSVDIPTRHTCVHVPSCPSADAVDHDAAHVVSARPEQGWSLLCNGVVVFEDFGELLPNGQCVDSRRCGEAASRSSRRAG